MPQIWSSFREKSTGVLAPLTVLLSLGGGLARVFTTLQEVPDTLILVGYLVGVSLNATLLAQIYLYRETKAKTKKRE